MEEGEFFAIETFGSTGKGYVREVSETCSRGQHSIEYACMDIFQELSWLLCVCIISSTGLFQTEGSCTQGWLILPGKSAGAHQTMCTLLRLS